MNLGSPGSREYEAGFVVLAVPWHMLLQGPETVVSNLQSTLTHNQHKHSGDRYQREGSSLRLQTVGGRCPDFQTLIQRFMNVRLPFDIMGTPILRNCYQLLLAIVSKAMPKTTEPAKGRLTADRETW